MGRDPVIVQTMILTSAIRAMLDPAVKRGSHCWDEIEEQLAVGAASLWMADGRGCVLTQVDADDVCDVVLGGGRDARSWVGAMEAAVRSHPVHAGVRRYRIWGRKGWQRLLPHWRFAGVDGGLTVLECDA